MFLAKDKYGRIGRQVPDTDLQAKVNPSQLGDRRGSVYLSTRSIEEDQAYYERQEQEAAQKNQSDLMRSIAERHANKIRQEKEAGRVLKFQKLAAIDPMNENLKYFFAKNQMMGETEKVQNSLRPPADFSQSGANPEYVEGERMTGGDQWSADFRQHSLVGNVLTRNGNYSPAVTDYDRFVQGEDVNQENVVKVVGGTMLGRMGGQNMGSFWDSVSDFATGAVTSATEQFQTDAGGALSAAATAELNKILGQGGKVTSSSGGVITVQRPPTVINSSQTLGLPTWALYAGGAAIGLTLLLVIIKATK